MTEFKVNQGKAYTVQYSVSDLGAMTTPDDMITISFKTPAEDTKKMHFLFNAEGAAGWRLRLIEGRTGGGENPTGSLTVLNRNRRSSNVPSLWSTDGDPSQGVVAYDATLFTGGTTLFDNYLTGTTGPHSGGSGEGAEFFLELGVDTEYQISLYGTDNSPASLECHFFEHESYY
jgi:hypothetical protein